MKLFFLTPVTFLISFTTLMLESCTDTTRHNSDTEMKMYFADLLHNVDKVQIQYFIDEDTLTQTLVKQSQIEVYKEVINGKEGMGLRCDTTGRLLYFIKDTLRLDAYFSTPATGSKYDTGVVAYFHKPDIYKTLFTYRAGMGVDEYFYELTKENGSTMRSNR